MNIKPLSDRVLLEPVSQEEKTESGIVLPDTAKKEKPEQGKVIAIGPGKLLKNGKRQKMDVKKGDQVIFSKFGPSEIEVGGKEYLIARTDDILAVIK